MELAMVFSAQQWAEQSFGSVHLGDERRRKRVVALARDLAQEPERSLPGQLQEPAEVKAAYRFFQTPQVSYEELVRPTIEQTRQACREREIVLFIQDTTEVDYQPHPKTTGLGPIGNGKHQGFLLQTVLAVDGQTKELLGLAQQEPFVRQPAPKGESYAQRQRRERESQVWERAVQAIGVPPPERMWIHVGDRYSDMYGFFAQCRAQQAHFVVRAAQDRCVDERVELPLPPLKRRPKREKQQEPTAHLFETVRSWAKLGETSLEVPAEHERKARTANLAISFGPLRLLAPDKQEEHLPALDLWVVRVWELEPPEGVEPLEWVLWTSVPIQTVEQAWQCVGWYRCRWIVEDYHQALKTGCRLEQRQLQSYEGLRRLLGVLAPLAVRLLHLRAQARQHPERLAEQVIGQEIVQLVALKTGVSAVGMTTEQCCKLIARLGGYQGRRGDGPPGWKTLWLGWLSVQQLLEGVHLAARLALE